MFNDLREFIAAADKLGECRVVRDADCNLEIGVLTDLQAAIPDSPLLLFDEIKGYKPGFRVASNIFTSQKRTALAYGLPAEARGVELVSALKDKISGMKLIPPVEVTSGPVKENILLGDDVDLLKFPAPKWHEFDGGRYIGTGTMTITRDPDNGWINLGTYRVEVHDRNTATVMSAPGHDAVRVREKYWAKGQACPAVVTCGQEPMLFAASQFEVPWGTSEYDYAGGLRGQPVEVVRGVVTDLPIPATAEIALEGEIVPIEVDSRIEGPFGEYVGYYGGLPKPYPAFRVKAILYRNNPIIQGNPPSRFPGCWSVGRHIQASAAVWSDLDEQVPGVKGVWLVEDASFRGITVVSLQQSYGGHAKQAGLLALGNKAIMRGSRFVVVVDEDIDPSNISEVLWALGTRTDPKYTIDFVDGCWGNPSNPVQPHDKLTRGDLEFSRAIILACKPYARLKEFPRAIKSPPELARKVRQKWPELFKGAKG